MILFWILVFIISLAALVKGADWLLESAEKIGLAMGLSPFIIGVTIIGMGTSLPELISSLAAVFKGATEIVSANVIGSNICNILLIVGICAIIGKTLKVTKSLIDLDLPLLALSTVILLGIVWDSKIVFFESLLLLITYVIYLLYTIFHKEEETDEMADILPSRQTQRKHLAHLKGEIIPADLPKPKITGRELILFAAGLVGLVVGAKYLIDSVIKISEILKIGTGVITISAVAVGTSLPELLVSTKAVLAKKSEVALGNIFGSNVFNGLFIIGFSGLFKTLTIDSTTFSLGVPTLALTTLIFVISGISRRIYIWEGGFYLALYVLFIAKLFKLF